MAVNAAARGALPRLRRTIARLEGRLTDAERLVLDSRATLQGGGEAGEERGEAATAEAAAAAATGLRPRPRQGRLRLGIAALDAALGGGLPLAALHEVRAEESMLGAAAAGFALALAARLAAAGGVPAILWIGTADLRREAGRLHAPGLAALGLDPARFVEVTARTEEEALWAFEAALGCRGVGMAVCELRAASLDLTVTRRAALRARDSGVAGLLLRLASPPEPTAAELRFALRPAPAGTVGGYAAGIGRMAWHLELEKNRGGPTGAFSVEWRSHERRFVEPGGESRIEPEVEAGRGEGDAHAHPQPLPAAPFDRPAAAPPAA